MEVPAPQAGRVAELKVKIGDKVSEGTVILVLKSAGAAATQTRLGCSGPSPGGARAGGGIPFRRIGHRLPDDGAGRRALAAILAAFRAADLGLRVDCAGRALSRFSAAFC